MAKLSISQAWDETRAILARESKLIAPVALASLVLPAILVNLIVPGQSNLAAAVSSLLLVAVVFLVTSLGQLSIIRLAMGPEVTVGDAIRHGARRTVPFAGAFCIWFVPFAVLGSIPYSMILANPAQPPLAASIGLIVLSLVGIILAVRLLVLGPVASAEDLWSLAIISRSWRLTGGHWWRLFAFVLFFMIGAVALFLAVESIVGLIARLTVGEAVPPLSAAGLVVIIIGRVLIAAIYVVLFVMQTRIYVQLAGGPGVPRSGT